MIQIGYSCILLSLRTKFFELNGISTVPQLSLCPNGNLVSLCSRTLLYVEICTLLFIENCTLLYVEICTLLYAIELLPTCMTVVT